jgi:hypothetical protein
LVRCRSRRCSRPSPGGAGTPAWRCSRVDGCPTRTPTPCPSWRGPCSGRTTSITAWAAGSTSPSRWTRRRPRARR